MLRLAVNGIDDQTRSGLAIRLRGVSLVPGVDPRDFASSDVCDAVAFLGEESVHESVVEPWLRSGKPALLLTELCEFGSWQLTPLLMLASLDHFLPSRRLLREQVAAGKLGVVGLVRSHRWKSQVAGEEGVAEKLPAALAQDLQLACQLVGQRPHLAFALRRSGFVQTHLGFPDGAMALVDYSGSLPPGDGYQALSVIGANGAAYIDDQQNVQLSFRGGPAQTVLAAEGIRPLATLVQEFADAVAAGRDFSVTDAAWQEAIKLLAAVGRSLETGQVTIL